MKTCPNCGSVLADNEPYCENCGFDPDFDIAITKLHEASRKPYYQNNHGKSSSPSQSSPLDVVVGLFVITVLIFGAWLILNQYNWDIGYIIMSNLDSIVLLPFALIFLGLFLSFLNQL